MNADQNLGALHRESLKAVKLIEKKAKQIVQECNGQVAVICYPHETLPPVFQGDPRYRSDSVLYL